MESYDYHIIKIAEYLNTLSDRLLNLLRGSLNEAGQTSVKNIMSTINASLEQGFHFSSRIPKSMHSTLLLLLQEEGIHVFLVGEDF